MLLSIQKNECVRSYVERALYVDPYGENAGSMRRMSNSKIVVQDAILLSKILGWSGCHGFNRLIHRHTEYAFEFMVKSTRDISYSENFYVSKRSVEPHKGYAYCPLCVLEDFERLGFSYWRRNGGNIGVCASHNVILYSNCPHCGKAFSGVGHNLNVLWKTCRGSFLHDAPAVANEDARMFSLARFYQSLYDFKYHIPLEMVAGRTLEVLKRGGRRFADVPWWWKNEAEYIQGKLSAEDGDTFVSSRQVVWWLPHIYNSFEGMARDVKKYNDKPRAIDSLWWSYLAGGFESKCYVQEDPKSNVSIWSCPYPSKRSLNPYSRDGWARRARKIYDCCN